MSSSLSDLELAYMAGIVDGEGTITAYHRPASEHSNAAFLVEISVSNTHRPTVESFHDAFGGSLVTSTGTNKPCFRWVARGKASCFALQCLKPHLRIKATQAALALALAETMALRGRTKKGCLSEAELAVRVAAVQKIQELNRC